MEEFLSDRRAEGYRLWLSTKAMVPVLAYLRDIGVVPMPLVVAAATEEERLQEHYRAYLAHERGLAPGTIAGYLHVARLLLAAGAAALPSRRPWRGAGRLAAPGPPAL